MADRRFETHISALWARLGLAAPRFGPTNRMVLLVENLSLDLVESRDGEAIMISGSPGQLASDALARSQQIRTLLRAHLSFLLTSRCALHLLEDTPAGPTPFNGAALNEASLAGAMAGALAIGIAADWRYAEGAIDTLVARIEDVVARIEFHQGDLAAHASSGGARSGAFTGRPAAGVEDGPHDFIIRL